MQGHKRGKGMSKSETGLQSLGQGSQIRVWNREGQAGSSTRSFKNRTKVCGWMRYTVGDLRTSSGRGDVWIGVPVRCYTECNRSSDSEDVEGITTAIVSCYLHNIYMHAKSLTEDK